MNLRELGPIRVATFPALSHDLVHFAWAAGRRFRVPVLAVGQVHVVGVLHYLFVGQLRQRLVATEHEYLPQGDCERPDVAFRRVLALREQNGPSRCYNIQHGVAPQLVISCVLGIDYRTYRIFECP